MKASDVKDGKVDSLELEITQKGEARPTSVGTVCDAVGKDETGEIPVSFWNDEIEKVQVGSKIRITNGWAKTFRGKCSVSAGKFGKLEIIS